MPRNNPRDKDLRVPVTADEHAQIDRRARACGLSVAAYLRQRGLGYDPRPIIDMERAVELVRAMSDLGRLGRLLKLWLTNDEKLNAYPAHQVRQVIPDVLQRIRASQSALLEIIQHLRKEQGRKRFRKSS